MLAATGCATERVQADAVRLPGRYLVATTTSRDFMSCLNDDGTDGPVSRIQVARVPDSGQVTVAFEWSGAVDEVAMVPRSDGAWLVWRVKKTPASGRIFGARLDPDGTLLTLPNIFVPEGQTAGPFAVDRMADDLAIAWLDALDPTEPTIRVQLFDQNATNYPHADFAMQLQPDEWPTGPLSLLGSPDGKHLLISWEALDPGGPGAPTVVTRRLDCIVPE